MRNWTLIENGLTMYLWIGANVDPSIIQNLFGVSNMQQLNVEKVFRSAHFKLSSSKTVCYNNLSS